MKYIKRDPLPEPIATWYRKRIAVGASTIFDHYNKGWESELYDVCKKEYIDHFYVSSVWFLCSVFLYPLAIELLTLFDEIGYTFSRHAIAMILSGSLAAGHTAMKFNLKENNEIEKCISTAWVHAGAAFITVGSYFQMLSTISPEYFFLYSNNENVVLFVEMINLSIELVYYWSPFALSLSLVITIMKLESLD